MNAGTKDRKVATRTSSVLRPARFVPFDEHKSVRIYRRNLPHWRQDGCTYFVTFRLVDSIPEGVRRECEYEQKLWLQARGIRYDALCGSWRTQFDKLPPQERFQFDKHFNRKVQACLDRGLGECWLTKKVCVEVVREQLFNADGLRYDLGDFVIMPNHVHLLITPVTSHELKIILKAIKGKAAIECNQLLQRSDMFWQPESYDHIVRDLEQLLAYREYIVGNSDRAGLHLPSAATYRAEWMDVWFRT